MRKKSLSLILTLLIMTLVVPNTVFGVTGSQIAADGVYTGASPEGTVTVRVSGGKITGISANVKSKYASYVSELSRQVEGKDATADNIDAITSASKHIGYIKSGAQAAIAKAPAADGSQGGGGDDPGDDTPSAPDGTQSNPYIVVVGETLQIPSKHVTEGDAGYSGYSWSTTDTDKISIESGDNTGTVTVKGIATTTDTAILKCSSSLMGMFSSNETIYVKVVDSESDEPGEDEPIVDEEIGQGIGSKSGTKYTGHATGADGYTDEWVTLDVYVDNDKITGVFINAQEGHWLDLLNIIQDKFLNTDADKDTVDSITSATRLGFRDALRNAVSDALGKKDVGGSDAESANIAVVKKVWSDGADAHKGDIVKAGLYNSEGQMVSTLTLDKSNSWTATVNDLDGSETYTVKEESVADKSGNDISGDYVTTYESESETVTVNGGWQAVDLGNVASGGVYAFTYDDGGTTYLLGRSGTSVIGSTSGLTGGTPNTNIGDDYKWTVGSATSGTSYGVWTLKNNDNNNYLSLTNGYSTGYRNSAIVSSGSFSYYSGMNLNFDDDGSIWAGYTGLNMYASGGAVASDRTNYTVFTPHVYIDQSTTTTTATFTITNTPDDSVEHHKTIEKTGDNEYSIKLDVTGKDIKVPDTGSDPGSGTNTTEPVDVVLLLDYSATMNSTRLANMKQQATAFINKLAGDNGDSRVAVVAYGQYSTQNQHININTLNDGWTTLTSGASSLTSALNAQGNLTGDSYSYGTDHGGAYDEAQKLFANSAVSNDGRSKYIVNISDGVFDYSSSPYYSTEEATAMKNDGVTIYYITVGNSADNTKVNSLATSSAHVYSGGNSGENIAAAFSNIEQSIEDENETDVTYTSLSMSNVAIKDTLSDNVEKNGDITVTDSDGIILTEGTDYTITENAKTITVTIGEVDNNKTYTVNIPVKVSQNAKDDFKNNGNDDDNYPDTSDKGIKGYYSNDNNENTDDKKVTLSYQYGDDGEAKTIPYEEKPVVKIVPDPEIATETVHDSIKITKVDEDGNNLSGATFVLSDGNNEIAAYADNPFTISTEDDELSEYLTDAGSEKELTLTEKTAPTGYKGSETTYTVRIVAAKTEEQKNGKHVTTMKYSIDIDGESEKNIENVKQTYTITWVDEDGTELTKETYKYGETPSYKGDTPVKDSTDEKTYTFDKWSPVIKEVTEDATYTATYTDETNQYTVTYTDGQGNVIKTETVDYGSNTPSCEDPAREGYTFIGWTPDIADTVTGNVTYTASWEKDPDPDPDPNPDPDPEQKTDPATKTDTEQNIDKAPDKGRNSNESEAITKQNNITQKDINDKDDIAGNTIKDDGDNKNEQEETTSVATVNKKAVQTGDSDNIYLYLYLIIISAATVIVLKRRSDSRNKR